MVIFVSYSATLDRSIESATRVVSRRMKRGNVNAAVDRVVSKNCRAYVAVKGFCLYGYTLPTAKNFKVGGGSVVT